MALRKPVVIASGEPQNLQNNDTLHLRSTGATFTTPQLQIDKDATNFFRVLVDGAAGVDFHFGSIFSGDGIGFGFNGNVILRAETLFGDPFDGASAASKQWVTDGLAQAAVTTAALVNSRTGSGVNAISDDTVASAATVDLTAVPGPQIDVTGTTTITTITIPAGTDRVLRFTGSLQLTHSATLKLPNAASITTQAGGWGVFRGEAAGVTRLARFLVADKGNQYFGGDVIFGGTFRTVGDFFAIGPVDINGVFTTAGDVSIGNTFTTAEAFTTDGEINFLVTTQFGTTVTVPFSGTLATVAGTTYTAGAGLALAGLSFSIAADGVTLAMMADMATASFLGRNTAATGNPEVLSVATTKTMLNLTGTNSGDQTITLTGDVTGTGTGSFAATISNGAVTLAKMANMATASILGRNTAGTGVPEVLSASTTRTLLGLATTSNVVFNALTVSAVTMPASGQLDIGVSPGPVLRLSDTGGTALRIMFDIGNDYGASLGTDYLTDSRIFYFPDQTGIFALTSDLTVKANLVSPSFTTPVLGVATATSLTTSGNLGIGTTVWGTSAAKVLGIGNGTEPSTSPADMVQLYSVDLSAGNATLGLRTETAVVTETVISDRTLSVRINGTTYKICLKA